MFALNASVPVTDSSGQPTKLNVDVGFLQGTLIPNGTNSLNAQVYVSSLTSPSVTIDPSSGAHIHLAASLGLGGSGQNSFPSVSTTISMDWTNLANPSTLNFQFGDVKLDLGSSLDNLVRPVLSDINSYLAPIQSVLNVLTEPIPGISALPGCSTVSLLTLVSDIAAFEGQGTDYAQGIQQLAGLGKELSTLFGDISSFASGGDIDFGSFQMNGSMIANPSLPEADDILNQASTYLGNSPLSGITVGDLAAPLGAFDPTSAVSDPGDASVVSDLQAASSDADLSFPLLDDPSKILSLMFGQNVPLVTFTGSFTAPSISTGEIPLAIVPVFGPIVAEVDFDAGVSASATIEAGYDTQGLREYLGGPTAGQISDLADGFYIQGPNGGDKGSNISVNGNTSLSVGAGVDLGFAHALVQFTGGINASIGVALNPNGAPDGKIRLSQLESESFGQLFAPTGNLSAGLTSDLDFSVLGFHHDITLVNFGQITIWSPDSATNPAAMPPEIYAISPAFGPSAGANQVTIYGANLENASVSFNYYIAPSAGAQFQFSDPVTDIISQTASSIVFDAPAQDPSQVGVTYAWGNTPDIVVTNNTSNLSSAPTVSHQTTADEYTYIPAPSLTEIYQHSGPAEGGTEVTMVGYNLISSDTTVDFGGIPCQVVSEQSFGGGGDQITVYSPGVGDFNSITAPELQLVTVTTPGGTTVPDTGVFGDSAETAGPDSFWNMPLPVITGFAPNGPLFALTPDEGPMTGGGTITIYGNNFGDPTTFPPTPTALLVIFNGYAEVKPTTDTYTPPRDNGLFFRPGYWELTAPIPASLVAGQVSVQIVTSAGESLAGDPQAQYTYFPQPIVTKVDSNAGPLSGLDGVGKPFDVVVTGSDFQGASAVYFGQQQATIDYVDQPNPNVDVWQIAVFPPAVTTPQSVEVTVTTPGGTSPTTGQYQDPASFAYISGPGAPSLGPASGSEKGGTTVTIYGSNLLAGSSVELPKVFFGSEPGTHVTVNQTNGTISVVSPAGTGRVPVTIDTVGGDSPAGNFAYFTYLPPPTVTQVSPNVGAYEGGTSVTISGTNLSDVIAVNFGETPATSFTLNSNGTISAIAPGGLKDQDVDVTVTTPTDTSATAQGDVFQYSQVLPVIDRITPATGPSIGFTQVEITGENLLGATEVDFGGTKSPSVFVYSPELIVAFSPAEAVGSVPITVDFPGGVTASPPSDDQFLYVPTPTITGLSQSTGMIAGGDSVTITGTNLDEVTAVEFGANAARIDYQSASQIRVTTPTGTPGTVDVTLQYPAGLSPTSSVDQFTYYVPQPVVTSVSPDSDVTGGGETVTITGYGLANATKVEFGTTAASIVPGSNTDTQIQVMDPGGAPGPVDVTVTTAGGTTLANPQDDQFTYGNAPEISLLYYNQGPLDGGGISDEIFGENLAGATAVYFGQTPAISFRASDSVIFATVPANIVDGQYSAGTVDVTVDHDTLVSTLTRAMNLPTPPIR